MRLQADFSMGSKTLEADFGTFQNASDGGYERGLQEGRQAEHDRFWDACQENGNRTAYSYAFCFSSWNDETFRPKYDLRPEGDASTMFRGCKITDLKGILERQGVVLDISGVTWSVNMFYECRQLTRLPELDFRNTIEVGFSYCLALVSIDKLILKEDGTNELWFTYCDALEHIRFDGVIGKALAMARSGKLTGESVQDIIDHLKDLTGQTSQTLTFHKNVGANITDAQKAQITAKNWTLVY